MASLDDVDLSEKLSGAEGLKRLQEAQRRLLALRLQAGGLIGDGRLGPPLCVVFEGWDASGKGGAIRRLTGPLDPRHVTVAQFAAPSDRVEGFASEPEWRRAYDEIISFERTLCDEGMVLVKFWLHISEQEQLRRFRARERDALKQWKLTDEDWRNLAHRPAYERAVADMLRHTDHESAPWRVVAAENKPHARVAVVRAVVDALEQGLRAAGLEPLDVEAAL